MFFGIISRYPGVLDYLSEYPKLPLFEDNASRVCPVCLIELDDPTRVDILEDPRMGALVCGHLFHPKCLQDMVHKGRQSNCPLCQIPIDRLLSARLDGATGQIMVGSRFNCTFRATTTQWEDHQYMGFSFKYHRYEQPNRTSAYGLRELTPHFIRPDFSRAEGMERPYVV